MAITHSPEEDPRRESGGSGRLEIGDDTSPEREGFRRRASDASETIPDFNLDTFGKDFFGLKESNYIGYVEKIDGDAFRSRFELLNSAAFTKEVLNYRKTPNREKMRKDQKRALQELVLQITGFDEKPSNIKDFRDRVRELSRRSAKDYLVRFHLDSAKETEILTKLNPASVIYGNLQQIKTQKELDNLFKEGLEGTEPDTDDDDPEPFEASGEGDSGSEEPPREESPHEEPPHEEPPHEEPPREEPPREEPPREEPPREEPPHDDHGRPRNSGNTIRNVAIVTGAGILAAGTVVTVGTVGAIGAGVYMTGRYIGKLAPMVFDRSEEIVVGAVKGVGMPFVRMGAGVFNGFKLGLKWGLNVQKPSRLGGSVHVEAHGHADHGHANEAGHGDAAHGHADHGHANEAGHGDAAHGHADHGHGGGHAAPKKSGPGVFSKMWNGTGNLISKAWDKTKNAASWTKERTLDAAAYAWYGTKLITAPIVAPIVMATSGAVEGFGRGIINDTLGLEWNGATPALHTAGLWTDQEVKEENTHGAGHGDGHAHGAHGHEAHGHGTHPDDHNFMENVAVETPGAVLSINGGVLGIGKSVLKAIRNALIDAPRATFTFFGSNETEADEHAGEHGHGAEHAHGEHGEVHGHGEAHGHEEHAHDAHGDGHGHEAHGEHGHDAASKTKKKGSRGVLGWFRDMFIPGFSDMKRLAKAIKNTKFSEAYEEAKEHGGGIVEALWYIDDHDFEELVDAIADAWDLEHHGHIWMFLLEGLLAVKKMTSHGDHEHDDHGHPLNYDEIGKKVLNLKVKERKEFVGSFNPLEFTKKFRILLNPARFDDEVKTPEGRAAILNQIRKFFNDDDGVLDRVEIGVICREMKAKLGSGNKFHDHAKHNYDFIINAIDHIQALLTNERLLKLYKPESGPREVDVNYEEIGQQILKIKTAKQARDFIVSVDIAAFDRANRVIANAGKLDEALKSESGRNEVREKLANLLGSSGEFDAEEIKKYVKYLQDKLNSGNGLAEAELRTRDTLNKRLKDIQDLFTADRLKQLYKPEAKPGVVEVNYGGIGEQILGIKSKKSAIEFIGSIDHTRFTAVNMILLDETKLNKYLESDKNRVKERLEALLGVHESIDSSGELKKYVDTLKGVINLDDRDTETKRKLLTDLETVATLFTQDRLDKLYKVVELPQDVEIDYDRTGDQILSAKGIKAKSVLKSIDVLTFERKNRILLAASRLDEALKTKEGRAEVKARLSAVLGVTVADKEDIEKSTQDLIDKLNKVTDLAEETEATRAKIIECLTTIKGLFDDDRSKKLFKPAIEIRDVTPRYDMLGGQILNELNDKNAVLGFLNKFEKRDLRTNFENLFNPSELMEAASNSVSKRYVQAEIKKLLGTSGKVTYVDVEESVDEMLLKLGKPEDYEGLDTRRAEKLMYLRNFLENVKSNLSDILLDEVYKAA